MHAEPKADASVAICRVLEVTSLEGKPHLSGTCGPSCWPCAAGEAQGLAFFVPFRSSAVRMEVYTFTLGQLCHPEDREQRLLRSDFQTREGYRGQADLRGPTCLVVT